VDVVKQVGGLKQMDDHEDGLKHFLANVLESFEMATMYAMWRSRSMKPLYVLARALARLLLQNKVVPHCTATQ